MNKRRVIRWVAFLATIFLAPLLALVVLLPMIVDSQAVKAKANAFIAEKTDGLARFEKIDLFWFPRPGVLIRDAAISFDQQIQVKIQQLRLYPSLLDLLTANLTFTSITADQAAWIVRLPARSTEPFDLDAVETKIRAAVKGLAAVFPGTKLRLHSSAADIAIAGRQSLMITDIEASLGVALDHLAFAVSARSNIAEGIRFAGEIATNNLASEAKLSVDRLALRQACEIFLPDSAGWVNAGAATLSVDLKAAGLKRFSAEMNGSVPSLTLARGTRETVIESKDFKVNVTGDEKMLRVAVASLPLVSPRLDAAGDVIFDRASSSFSVKLAGRDLDAGMIRKSALILADDVAGVSNVFRYVQSGTIPEIHFESRGSSLAEAFDLQHAVVTANVRGGKIFVPGPALDLENVSGAVLISAGVLECTKCAATLEKAQGRDGVLRVDLANPNGPFHLDIRVDSDAKQLQSLLIRHVPDARFSKEVARLRDVAGSLSGRLVLGETLDAISAKVFAVEAALTASYEAVPYPISLKGGRLNYDDGRIEAENLAGAVGRSSFSGLNGSLLTHGTEQVDIKSASVQLDLEQTELLLRKVKTVQTRLGPKDSARGTVDFAAISLTGPLNDPSRWDFTGRGKVAEILVKHALLPGPVAIAQGTFEATHEKLTFADAKVQILDASITGSGVVENWRKVPLRVQATANGIAGARMMDWLRRQNEIPANYRVRSPVEFSAARVAWRGANDFVINSKLTVDHGPRVSVDLARTASGYTVKELLIDDGGQSARATFDLERDKWGVGLSGTLSQRTLSRIFATAPLRIGLLQGNFSANAFRQPPYRLSARGTLAAKDLVLPLNGEQAAIDHMVVQGDPAGLNIRSADLRWRRSHISVSGKLATSREAWQVDMNVAADRLVWDELSAVSGAGDGQGSKSKAGIQLPPLEGVVRLKAANFAVGGLSWSPLQVTAGLAANGITGEVQNSVLCGIRTAGSFAVQKNNQIDLDAQFSVKDGALQSTSRCLSLGNFDISGTYSLDARLKARASGGQLAQSLSGEFDFVARDGKFVRAGALDATFDYLNDTGDFKMAFPDLDKEAFPYRLVSAKGTVERQSIFAKEIIIEASPYTITAQGSADLERKTIDGKGLVTVLLPAANIIKSIPLFGSILSASMVGIPVEVSGALDRPRVSYLSPAALGAELVNIPLRILKAPLDALQIFTPFLPGSEQK